MTRVIVTGGEDGTVSPQLHARTFAAAAPQARLVTPA